MLNSCRDEVVKAVKVIIKQKKKRVFTTRVYILHEEQWNPMSREYDSNSCSIKVL